MAFRYKILNMYLLHITNLVTLCLFGTKKVELLLSLSQHFCHLLVPWLTILWVLSDALLVGQCIFQPIVSIRLFDWKRPNSKSVEWENNKNGFIKRHFFCSSSTSYIKKSLKVFRLKAAILGLKFVNLVMLNCSL